MKKFEFERKYLITVNNRGEENEVSCYKCKKVRLGRYVMFVEGDFFTT